MNPTQNETEVRKLMVSVKEALERIVDGFNPNRDDPGATALRSKP